MFSIIAMVECPIKLEVDIDSFEGTFCYLYHSGYNVGNRNSFKYLYEKGL